MSAPFIRAIDFFVNGLIILLLMKQLVDPREFFFNPALRPIDTVTDPILERLRKHFHFNRLGIDYTPLFGICTLILLYILSNWILMHTTFIRALIISVQKLLFFLIRFFSFSVFVLVMVPVYSRNPISSFFKKVIIPFEKPFRRITGGDDKKPSLVTTVILILLAGVLGNVFLESFAKESPIAFLGFWKNWVLSLTTVMIAAISIYRFIVILLIAAVILSWINAETRNPFISLVFVLTEPILLPVRRYLPPAGGLDLSPWIASLIIGFSGSLLTRLLIRCQLWLI